MDVAYFGPVDGVYVRTLHETLSHPGVVSIEHITDMIHPGCQTSPGGRYLGCVLPLFSLFLGFSRFLLLQSLHEKYRRSTFRRMAAHIYHPLKVISVTARENI